LWRGHLARVPSALLPWLNSRRHLVLRRFSRLWFWESRSAGKASAFGRRTRATKPELVIEAVERMVNYDEWFLAEVENGLAAAERGHFVEHRDLRKLIDRRYPA